VAERQQFLDLLRPGSLATNVKRQVPFGYFVNLEQMMAALRRIAQDGKHILPTHDPEVYTLYPDGIEQGRCRILVHHRGLTPLSGAMHQKRKGSGGKLVHVLSIAPDVQKWYTSLSSKRGAG
jgi:hypothetical protein